MTTFNGAWPALVTPFTKDDTVNLPVLKSLTDYFIDLGVGGLFVCGSTGEGLTMSVKERKLVAETVLKQTQKRVPVIVHVGCMAACDAIELARHARQSGADGVSSIIPPHYGEFGSLYDYYEAIATAAPDLPFLPYIAGGSIDAVELMSKLMQIPNVAGTKYTGPNMYEFKQIVDLRSSDWNVFSGMDAQCIFAAMSGSCGNIGSSLNIMPDLYRKIHECCETGDFSQAMALQNRANRITAVIKSFGAPHSTIKGTLLAMGFDCGRPRLPSQPLSEEKRKAMLAQLEDVGLFTLLQSKRKTEVV